MNLRWNLCNFTRRRFYWKWKPSCILCKLADANFPHPKTQRALYWFFHEHYYLHILAQTCGWQFTVGFPHLVLKSKNDNCSEVACIFWVVDLAAFRQKCCDLLLWIGKCSEVNLKKKAADLAAIRRFPFEITAFRQKRCDLRVSKNVVDLAAFVGVLRFPHQTCGPQL